MVVSYAFTYLHLRSDDVAPHQIAGCLISTRTIPLTTTRTPLFLVSPDWISLGMLTHYQALEVSRSADLVAIKKAYHKISLLYHPDKTVHLSVAERIEREQLFKLANVAFEVLSDPQKRKAYDQTIQIREIGPTTQARNAAARHATAHPPDDPVAPHCSAHGDRRPAQDAPPRFTTAEDEDAQSSHSAQGIQRAPISAHRFTASTLGKAPDFHWHHCQLDEYDRLATLTYNNWLGWNFSINVASYFKVVARPIIPQKPVSASIVVRLPLLRKGIKGPRASNEVAIDIRGVPGNKQIILCSTLAESEAAGLELVVQFVIAPDPAQAIAQGPLAWKWAYGTDHEPLGVSTQTRVTNMLFYPYNPFMAVAPRGGMPAPPYPEESPMRGLLTQFPGMKIEEPVLDSYCVKEEQQGKTMWRLTAVGSM